MECLAPKCFFAIALAALAAPGARAASLPLYLMDVPPMAIANSENQGIVGDITREALKRAGYQAQIKNVPSPRAMTEVHVEKNTLIIPLARNRERERSYTWIAPIVRVERAFFTIGKRVNSFADAKARLKSVAVSRGTVGVDILRDQGFTPEQIQEVNQGDTAPKMLLAGHADAWFNLISESASILKNVENSTGVVHGAPVDHTFNYLACTKECDPSLVKKLRQALKGMVKDGTYRRLAGRYGTVPGIVIADPLKDLE
jgi:polar amino acid transport system substrate-binding protein